jgi:hypothetical protein
MGEGRTERAAVRCASAPGDCSVTCASGRPAHLQDRPEGSKACLRAQHWRWRGFWPGLHHSRSQEYRSLRPRRGEQEEVLVVDSYGAEPSVWSRRPPRRPRAAYAEIGDKALPMSAMGKKLTWRDRAGTSASEGRAEIWTWRWSLSWLATFRSSISMARNLQPVQSVGFLLVASARVLD